LLNNDAENNWILKLETEEKLKNCMSLEEY